jgi:hypothetical protein
VDGISERQAAMEFSIGKRGDVDSGYEPGFQRLKKETLGPGSSPPW